MSETKNAIELFRARRRKLEDDICDAVRPLIRAFEEETGVELDAVSMDRGRYHYTDCDGVRYYGGWEARVGLDNPSDL